MLKYEDPVSRGKRIASTSKYDEYPKRSAAGAVRFIGVVEIVLQALATFGVLASVLLLVFGMSLVASAPKDNEDEVKKAGTIQGLMLGVITLWVASLCFNAWMVYLVYTGGYSNNIRRLRLWHIIQSVFLAFSILTLVVAFSGSYWYMATIYVTWIIYRTFSIIAVRAYIIELEILQAHGIIV